uniref:Uncharacterized protein n=1 Tax=Cyprinus carpio TaxID=7962 RepID=A0A8C1LUU1_CYPCA
MKIILTLFENVQCRLEKLKLNCISITDEGCAALASAFNSNLRELDLSRNQIGDSGVTEISSLLRNSQTLQILSLKNNCITEGGCHVLAAALNSNPSNLTELDLSENKLGNPGMKIILTLFENVQCRLEKLKLNCISITDQGCGALASAFNSNLRELDLSRNQIGDSGVTEISSLLRNSQTLQILRLSDCSITEEGYKALSSALRSNPSHLIELDLTGNDPGPSGVKQLSDLLQDPNCQLKTLRLNCISITDEGCAALASAFNSNLRELDLSRNQIGDSGVTEISSLLRNSQTLQILRLSDCSITEEGYKALSSALRSNPSHLIELDLTGNDPGPSGVKQLSDLLQDPNCQLKTLRFLGPAADEGCQYVTGIVGKNPLLLRELDLSKRG